MNVRNTLVSSRKLLWFIGLLVLAFSTLSGCYGSIRDSMHVVKGEAPENQDNDVLFRNIYYFRVFEYCLVKKEDKIIEKIFTKDNLFRFRMTGKGYPLFLNKVRFEAGTLHKSEIDPFGNPITIDKRTGHFRYTSKQEMELEKNNFKMEVFDKEYAHLLDMAKKLEASQPSLKESKEFKNYIDTRIKGLTKAVKNQPDISDSPSGFIAACNGKDIPKQEFWILGPEGWRRFNPDDRLVLAMSTSGKPIIGPMKELAGRILNEQAPEEIDKQTYDAERVRINNAENYLLEQEKTVNQDKKEKIINVVIEKLKDKK